MSASESSFVEAKDRDAISAIVTAFYREWGNNSHFLKDAGDYYTLVVEEIKGPDICEEEKVCAGKIDLFLARTLVSNYRPKIRDFRFEWKELDMAVEIDIFKHSSTDRKCPKIEWKLYDPLVWDQQLDAMGMDARQLPAHWNDLNPVCKAIVRTIYNKAEHHPAHCVKVGIEPASCYLKLFNLDHIDYAVLEMIAQQSHLVDIRARAWDRRLDIRIKKGPSTPWPDRYVEEETNASKREASVGDINPSESKR